ncbi:hypothetical protein DFH06DRAFT_1447569 [Mycena polygramma]|nr:hypothetical protein DFH06DRAFT_1447569 [Mycena polygramma]
MASKGTVLVTGAARGIIGKAIALRLAEDGFDIAVNDVSANSEELARLMDEIIAKGTASSAHVSLDDEVCGMIETVVKNYGSLDVMVANAGSLILYFHPTFDCLATVTSEQWDHIININARGVLLCYKYAGLQIIKQGNGGRIIGASSISALEFGVHGITVNAYAPGAIDTAMREHPVDVAHLVSFIASKESQFITVNGGMYFD